jgi:uncharacterized UPF0160 family protein
MTSNKDVITVVTHSGAFHADDVFACATLALYFKDKEIKITRSRDRDIFSKADILVDVGEEYNPEKLRFDHHQKEGAGSRENNIPYASFGLVWKEYGEFLTGNKESFQIIDDKIVAPIDAGDNGIELTEKKTDISPYRISSMVGSFNSSWTENAEVVNDLNFSKMVGWAKDIILREIVLANDFLKAQSIVEDVYKNTEDKRIIVLDGPYPADDVLQKYSEPLYIVKLRQDGRWGLKCVRAKDKSFDNRKDLPKEWSGLRDEALQKLTGVHDAVFCHKALFLAAAASKEGALELARLAVEY